ncbi:hypothetical protein Tco_1099407 [Tanacetum coccineum]
MERHAYCERLSKLQLKEIGTPRVAAWSMFYVYNFDETLKELMKFEYLHSDGDVFVDYSWERALSIEGDVYPEWLCEREHVLTLPEFAILLGLYEESEEPTRTNPRTSLILEPIIRIVRRLIVGYLVHRLGSKERCQKRDLWIMSALEESRSINLAWLIAEHLCKHALELKENSLICGGHYLTKIAKSLGYLVDEEVAKYSKPIKCEKWTEKMLAGELDLENHAFLGSTSLLPPPKVAREQRQEPSGLNSSLMPSFEGTSIVPSSSYEVGGSSRAIQDDDDASMSQ